MRSLLERVREPRGKRAALLVAVVLLLVLGLVVSGGDGDPAPSEPKAAGSEGPAREPGVSAGVTELVAEMPTERKVAQLMLVGLEGTETDDAVLSSLEDRGYAGLVLEARNYVSPDQVTAVADEARSLAEEAGHPTPWLMAPQEGGKYNAFADLPPEEAPAEVGSRREAGELAEETGEALMDTGMSGILAPVLDVGPPGGGALGERAYSDIEDEVRGYARATVEAYRRAGIFAAAKHFPGLGSASQPTELGPANIGLTLSALRRRDLVPFEAAIEAGVPGIVVGHGLYGVDDFVTPASMSERIVTGLLRDELKFKGVAITDDLTAPAITATLRPTRAAIEAVQAGADLVYVSRDDEQQEQVYEALLDAVQADDITPERLDEAVSRNLEAKREAGQLELGDDGVGEGEGEIDGPERKAPSEPEPPAEADPKGRPSGEPVPR
jgi:beta-N-acetylhexosaminidase